MKTEVLFKYKGYRSVIYAHKSLICGEVERHLELSKATVNPRVICSSSVHNVNSLPGSSSGFNLFFLQRWSPKWNTYINVKDEREIEDSDWLTVTKELSETSMFNSDNDTDGVSKAQQDSSVNTSRKKPIKGQRKVSVTVALLDKFQRDVPKGAIRTEMKQIGKIKRIRVYRSETSAAVKEKILEAFKKEKAFDYYYLECVSFGSKLIRSAKESMNGQDAVDRRGCLYICKEPQQEASIVTISSCEPKRMKTDDDDDDLPLPPFKKKRQCKSSSPEKIVIISSDDDEMDDDTQKMESTVDEELANFRQSREEQDQEYAESLDETKEEDKQKEVDRIMAQKNAIEELREQLSQRFTMGGNPTDQPGITVRFRLPQGLSISHRFGLQGHTKDLYEFAFAMGDMDQPFFLVTNIPRREISMMGLIIDAGITDSTLLYVEENEHGINLTETFGEGRSEDEAIEEEKEDDAEKSSDVIAIEGEEDRINHDAPSSSGQTTNNSLPPTSSDRGNYSSQPSSSHHQLPFCTDVTSDMDKLTLIFPNLSSCQIKAIYNASHSNFSDTVDCILQGPTTEGIRGLLHNNSQKDVTNLAIDPSEIWHDMVAFYKLNSQATTLCPRIRLRGSVGIDIGGIRKQMFTTTYMEFAENKHIKLFEGETNNLRPINGSFVRHSGLFKVLGTMIAHSIALDGIGFPYFSKFCYRYIAEGEEKALEAINLDDVGHNVKAFIEKLNEAVTNADLQFSKVEEQINALDLMSNAGVEEQLSMMNKDLVAQAVIHTETIHKCGKQLDEIKDGLGSIMELIQAFPELFEEFFVAKPLTGDDIIDALYTTTHLNDNQKIVMQHLEKYAKSLSLKGAQDFLQFVTGTVFARRRSIFVNFDDGDEGEIAALTCGSTIVLPTRPFKDDEGSYQLFTQALQAVIPNTDYNQV